jgi:hypothetical protein
MRTIMVRSFHPASHPRECAATPREQGEGFGRIHVLFTPAAASLPWIRRRREGAIMSKQHPCLSRAAAAGQAILLAAMLAGCAVYAEPAPVYRSQPVHIPPGHYPPPGACRVWYPDRPPGHQPPPGPCHVLRHQVPPGAVLVQG